MSEPVKRDSPSKSGRGQARTRLARRAVVDAARTLFLERGYVATTIEAISEHSDVPSRRPCTGSSPRSSGSSRPCSTRPSPVTTSRWRCRNGQTSPRCSPKPTRTSSWPGSPASRRRSTSGRTTSTASSTSAAGSDPAAAELLDEIRQQRDRGQGRIARSLARATRSSPGCENATPPT